VVVGLVIPLQIAVMVPPGEMGVGLSLRVVPATVTEKALLVARRVKPLLAKRRNYNG
jgi:hypothetical protein